MTKLHLRDLDVELIRAWRDLFADLIAGGQVTVSCGDIFDGIEADALVSPANSFGHMDGGIDALYLQRFGFDLQERVRDRIQRDFAGELPVGQAALVSTKSEPFRWLVVAPTMRVPGNVSATVNAYLALRAALLAVTQHNASNPGDAIESILCPGLATAIGEMDPVIAARQMRIAWDNVIHGVRWHSLEDARRSQGLLKGLPWALKG